MKKATPKILLLFLLKLIVVSTLAAQTTNISPQLRRYIQTGIDSGFYQSMFIAVINESDEEYMIINGKEEELSGKIKIDVTGLFPVWMSLQMADMLELGISPDLFINEILDKDQRIRGKLGKKLQLLHFALQTSGLSANGISANSYCTNHYESILDLSDRIFEFAPGSVYSQISNDQIYLSKILLKKQRLPCEVYFNENLFRKINLTNTCIINGAEIQPGDENFEKGAFVSTPDDLIKLMKIQTGLKNVRFQDNIQLIRKYRKETGFKNNQICPGWFVYQSDRGEFYYQFMRYEKMTIYMIFEPKLKRSVIVVSKSEENLDFIPWHIMLNENLNPVKKHIQNIEIKNCVGEYTYSGDEVISIIRRDGKMILFFNGEEAHICYPLEGRQFLLSAKGISLQFVINDKEEVLGLYLRGYSPNMFQRLN